MSDINIYEASLDQLLIDAIKLNSEETRNFFHELESYLCEDEEDEEVKQINEAILKRIVTIDQDTLVDEGYYAGVHYLKSFIIHVSPVEDRNDAIYGKIRDVALINNKLHIANMANTYYEIHSLKTDRDKKDFYQNKADFCDKIFDRAAYLHDKHEAIHAWEVKGDFLQHESDLYEVWKEQLKDIDNEFEKRRLPKPLQEIKASTIDKANQKKYEM